MQKYDFGSLKKNKNIRKIISYIKMKLSCFASVTIRCLCPYEEDIKREYGKNKDKIIEGVFFFVLSFLLGLSKLDVGFLPFGLAMLCTAFGKNTIFCFCAGLLSSLFEGRGGLVQFVAFFLLFLLRRSISRDKFDEKLVARILYAFFTSAFVGASTLFTSSVTGKTVLSYFTYVLLSVMSVYLFSGIVCKKNQERTNSYRLLSFCSVCLCLVPAFNRLSFSTVDLGLVFGSLATLYFCMSKGPVYGCALGFVMGFACVNPMCSAPLGLSGLVSGYLMTRSMFAACLAFPVTSFFVLCYIFGLNVISQTIPYVFSSSLLFLALHKNLPDILGVTGLTVRETNIKRCKKLTEFDKVSESLSGLSAILYKFSEHMKAPGNAETKAVIDKAFSNVCKDCSMSEMCYAKRECNLSSVYSKLISTLHSRRISEDELSVLLLNKCIRSREMCDYINFHYSELHFLTMKSNRTQTAAGLYNSMSRLIRSTGNSQEEKEERDTRLEKQLSDTMKKIGIEFSFVNVCGKRCKEIYVHGIKPEKIPCTSRELSRYLSGECRIKLSEPTFDISDSADIIMKFISDDVISVEYAQCTRAKDDESVNGDTTSFFETENGYFYSVIADGMGSGKAAAATSRLSCVFLEKMLSAGAAKNVCIEMLNNLLLSKNDETFSGIDLLEIDKKSGSAYFIKAGAAPSFVLRKSRLYKISSQTPPVGIIPAFSAESTRFSLERGDVILMVSDGVVQSDSDAVWISELLSGECENEPALLASKLLEKSSGVNERDDDASACVVKII